MALGNDRKYALVIAPIIINECINRGYKINTSKLMKLLYYMQKLHIQKYGEPMFTNEIIAGEFGPYIADIMSFFPYGALGFKEEVEQPVILLRSHEDVASMVLDEYGSLEPIELMKKSLEDEIFKTIWQDGIGKNQIIPYYIMGNEKKDYEIKILSKNNKKEFNKDILN